MRRITGAGTMGKGNAIEFARFGNKVVLVSYQRHFGTKSIKWTWEIRG